MYSYLTSLKNVAFHAKFFLRTTTKGPPPRCVPQGPHHPRSTLAPHTSITQLTSFIDYFTQKLSMLNTRENTFACGDFNINLLSITANEHHSSYLEGILSSGFYPAITLPTRLSKNSTLIDNIFINKHKKLNFAGILNNEISDHQIVAVDMDLIIPPNKTYYITVFSNSD